ncbi:TetR family transcriptional regulator [Catenuloplanes atrovinosus]|uniref:AcrR family transcriptional regulator n=1 Tax=Catenuloplanes atrovinosus TaxID=137266 RepID=A0AAE3YM55_9ACTN|nr:TetR family transcriptional regulator [Catenuloplanes atrovinosus]MDR7275057.1 AcrR family transcriptional regulator [Catenuloplanes atrovinosus]
MAALDTETIMVATEDVLRRYGWSKATVVDVARALGVSHAAVYRHFPSKVALREAVARRWLSRAYDELAAVAADPDRTPPERLRAWLLTLFRHKRRAAVEEPELFETYGALVREHSAVSAEHVAVLLDQLEGIVAGMGGDRDAARAVLVATTAFHHPAHVAEWGRPDRERLLDDVCTLLIRGLE